MYFLAKLRSDSPVDSTARRAPSIEDNMSASSDEPKKCDRDTGGICRSKFHLCSFVVSVFHDLVNAAKFIGRRGGWSFCGPMRGMGEVSGLKIV